MALDLGPIRRSSAVRRLSAGRKKRIAYKQEYLCNKCKKLLPPEYEVDHITPLFKGGTDDEINLQALCPNCHAEKTSLEREMIQYKCTKCNYYISIFFQTHGCPNRTIFEKFKKSRLKQKVE